MTDLSRDLLKGWDVVVIDDEEDSLEVASYILRFYGATVHTARNGAEGFKLIQEIHPRFVISDLSMPISDGWDLIRNVQNDPAIAQIPMIALTAHAMIGDREKALAAGFYNYLTKPLSAKTFMNDLLNLLLENPQLSSLITR